MVRTSLSYDNDGHSMKKVKSTPKRLNTSIKFDAIHPKDYLRFDLRMSCEDCTHFNHGNETCTLGYVTQWHRAEFQKKSYELTGRVALCRFQEID
jgi:hypothetical protein